MSNFIPEDAVTPCRTGDPERFFTTTTAGRLGDAWDSVKAECEPCPFREPCLSWAVKTGETGIWAGTDDRERKKIRKEHGIRIERPPVILFANTPRSAIPHGTEGGVEAHRKNGSKVCKECQKFLAANRPDAFALQVCELCGRAMLPKSLPRHRRTLHSSKAA